MIAGGDVRLDGVGLLQRVLEQRGRDLGGVDLAAGEREARVGDDVQRRVGVLVGGAAVARVDVVDQALVERPGVHLALPLVDDGVAEAVDLGLLVGHPASSQRGAGGGESFRRGLGDQRVDRRGEPLRGGERVAVARLGDIGIGVDDCGLFLGRGRHPRRGREDRRGGEQSGQSHLNPRQCGGFSAPLEPDNRSGKSKRKPFMTKSLRKAGDA